MSRSSVATPIIVALDCPSAAAARAVLDALAPSQCRVKIGKELFVRAGPEFVAATVARGFDVFLDLKFHDIPNTVAAACVAAAELGVWMINVHASGGSAMLQAARAALRTAPPYLIAVTVLTSLTADDLAAIGCPGTPDERVARLARLSQAAGLDGIVCSPHEARTARALLGDTALLVTPGVRPATAPPDDQRRTMTPAAALHAGADYLVIGRPIVAAPDPAAALAAIADDIAKCGMTAEDGERQHIAPPPIRR